VHRRGGGRVAHMPLGFVPPAKDLGQLGDRPCLKGQAGLVGRKRKVSKEKGWTTKEKGKRGLILQVLNLDVLSKLSYMITLIKQQYATICRAMP
jgi:hypothetical protein